MTSKQAIKLLKWHGSDREDVMELYKVIEDEIADLKHNYNVVKERFENSADYGAKIQAELNELKYDVARFMVLLESNVSYVFLGTQDISDEFDELEDKLKKVGKAE